MGKAKKMRTTVDFYYEGPRSNNYSWNFYFPHVAFGFGEGYNEDQRQLYIEIGFAFLSACLQLTYSRK